MALYIAQDGFALHVPAREPIVRCAYCGFAITSDHDYRNVMVGGKPAKSHRYCSADCESPRG
jgi:hypothetical protein